VGEGIVVWGVSETVTIKEDEDLGSALRPLTSIYHPQPPSWRLVPPLPVRIS
jgi:hypothetical protein